MTISATGTVRTLQATIPHPRLGLVRGWVCCEQGIIRDVGVGTAPAPLAVDLGGLVLAPGFVDAHVHGGDGAQTAGDDPALVADQVLRLARFHLTHGTTRLLATTVSDTHERLCATLAGVKRAQDAGANDGAQVAGAHLEGPWIAHSRRGAHDTETLRRPTVSELDALIGAAGGGLRLVTLAPELPGALAVIAAACARGVRVSIGHTEASYEQAKQAIAAGASHLTHLGNAMPPLDRRQPGPIAAALSDPRVTVEVIADGEHVHPAMLMLVASLAGGRLVAVTDAISATGLPDGRHLLGTLAVTVSGQRAVRADEPATLAGSVLTLDRAVGVLVAAGLEPVRALHAVSAAPARVVGVAAGERPYGRLAPGYQADLVVLDGDWHARATILAGRAVHDPDGLLAEL